jgi:PAS domain S-box-containing protein
MDAQANASRTIPSEVTSRSRDQSTVDGSPSGRALGAGQHLAAIVDNSDDAIVSMAPDGIILSWNDAATRMYDYTAAEAVGRPIDIVIPEDAQLRAEELEIRGRIAQGERIHHIETFRRTKHGHLIEVSLSISPVRNASGTIVAAAGIARDISERKLFQAKQHLAAIVDNSDDAIVSKDLSGTILSWNEAATQMYGYTLDEAMGRPIDIVIPEDERLRAQELEIRERIAHGERIHHIETVRRHEDGHTIDVSLSISPVRDSSGKIVAAAGIARDISERNRAFETGQHLAAIVNNSDDAIVSKDLSGTILSWNEAATQMYGYAAEEAMGRPIDIVIPEDERLRAQELEIRERIAHGERIHHIDTVRRHKDGHTIDVSLSISPVRDASGRIIAAAGIARDISEQNRAFDTKQHLAAIVNNSDDAIVSKDLSGTILSWNDAATHVYGHTLEEALGRPIDIVIPEDEHLRAEELEIRERIGHGERIHHMETVRRHKDGHLIEVSLSISPVRDASGKIVAAAGIARDITERKLFQAKQHLAAIVETSDDAIVSKALDGTILSWNEAATQMYGYSAEQALGRPIDIVIPEEFRNQELEIRDRIAQGERIHHRETRRCNRGGQHIDVSLSVSPVWDTSGRIVAAADIARDISKRRQLEEERERARGLLERFVDFAAHDFKTPMHHILWFGQEATRLIGDCSSMESGECLSEVRVRLEKIVANSFWMNNRTEALLRASGLQGPRQIRTQVNAEKAFDESLAMLRSVDLNVADAYVTRGSLPVVASDEYLLGFLFQNLLQNAIKFGQIGQPVRVHVSAVRRLDAWRFTVADNGMGVPEHLREQIFEPHMRAPDVEAPGTGIGLTFCRRIVDWHGGRIWVEPGRKGGSRFSFTIPDQEAPPT